MASTLEMVTGTFLGLKKITDGELYGDLVVIEKLECVNHVKKRMGTRLG